VPPETVRLIAQSIRNSGPVPGAPESVASGAAAPSPGPRSRATLDPSGGLDAVNDPSPSIFGGPSLGNPALSPEPHGLGAERPTFGNAGPVGGFGAPGGPAGGGPGKR
jgi:hypothetical protein